MRIGSTYTKGTHPGPPRPGWTLPLPQLRIDVERALLQFHCRVWLVEMQCSGNEAMFERKRSFDQASNTRGWVKMTEIALDRADRAKGFVGGSCTKRACQR